MRIGSELKKKKTKVRKERNNWWKHSSKVGKLQLGKEAKIKEWTLKRKQNKKHEKRKKQEKITNELTKAGSLLKIMKRKQSGIMIKQLHRETHNKKKLNAIFYLKRQGTIINSPFHVTQYNEGKMKVKRRRK